MSQKQLGQPKLFDKFLAKRVAEQTRVADKRNRIESVFTHIFTIPEYLLQLFQALYPDRTNIGTSDIIPLVLHNVVLEREHNDLVFLAKEKLIFLLEEPAVLSPNIVLREFLYFNHVSERLRELYDFTDFELLTPKFYILYTGSSQDRPEELSLRKNFWTGQNAALDLKAKIIYDGQPGDIINQYVTFCHILDAQSQKLGRTVEAVRETTKICKDTNVLKEYLQKYETEVIKIMKTLFDQETATKNYVASEVREAREDERQKTTLEVNLTTIRNLMETLKLSAKDAMSAMKIPMDQQSMYAEQL